MLDNAQGAMSSTVQGNHLAEAAISASVEVAVAGKQATWRAWTSDQGGIAAEHGDPRSVLGASKRDHMLSYVGGYELAVMTTAIREDVLDEVVAKLITGDCSPVSRANS